MTNESDSRSRDALAAAVKRTPGCVPIERFGALSDADARHVSACAHCESELELWQQFERSDPSAADGAAVLWIAAEVARRRASVAASAPRPVWGRWLAPQMLAVAAAVTLVLGLAYVTWDRQPQLTGPDQRIDVYRGAQIEGAEPSGDLPAAPEALKWLSVPAATRYDVFVREVDGTVLWRSSSTSPQVTLPSKTVSQLVPGKTVIWEVTARDRAGTVIAGTTRQIRVVPRS